MPPRSMSQRLAPSFSRKNSADLQEISQHRISTTLCNCYKSCYIKKKSMLCVNIVTELKWGKQLVTGSLRLLNYSTGKHVRSVTGRSTVCCFGNINLNVTNHSFSIIGEHVSCRSSIHDSANSFTLSVLAMLSN